MKISVSLRILGILLMLFSISALPPLVLAFLAEDGTVRGFLSAMGITFFAGLLMWLMAGKLVDWMHGAEGAAAHPDTDEEMRVTGSHENLVLF